MRSREQKNRHPIRSSRVLGLVALGFVVGGTRLCLGRLWRTTVRGESMTPSLSPGDQLVVWRPIRPLRPGHVVVYRDRFDGGLRVKRVAMIDHGGSVTVRGDNAVLSTDERDLGPVGPDQIVGVAVLRRGSGRSWSRLRYDLSR